LPENMNKKNIKKCVAIIPARGASKSIPGKNIIDFCGKPLIAWTIEQALESSHIDEVYVTSDDKEILDIAAEYGAKIIKRPSELATDISTSEDALLHAITEIENDKEIELVTFFQATSPLREIDDINMAIERFFSEGADSLFSATLLNDFYAWEPDANGLRSITFDYKKRTRRQDNKPYYLENGSIYIFKPKIIKQYKNRLGGKIALYYMPFWKSYEINNPEDTEICKYYMKNKILKR